MTSPVKTPHPSSALSLALSSPGLIFGNSDEDNDSTHEEDRVRSRSESFHENVIEKAVDSTKIVITPDTPLLPQHLRLCMLLGINETSSSAGQDCNHKDVNDEAAEETNLEQEETRQIELWLKGGEGRAGAGSTRSSSKWTRRRRSTENTPTTSQHQDEASLVPFIPVASHDTGKAAIIKDTWLLPRAESKSMVLVVHVDVPGSSSSSEAISNITWSPMEYLSGSRRARCIMWECVQSPTSSVEDCAQLLSSLMLGCDAILFNLAQNMNETTLNRTCAIRKALKSSSSPSHVGFVITSRKAAGKHLGHVKMSVTSIGATLYERGVPAAVEMIALSGGGNSSGAGNSRSGGSSSSGKCTVS